MATVLVLLIVIPWIDWFALRFTVCEVLGVVMLNIAVSDAPGGEAGLGVAALLAVDQGATLSQPVPVPSQKILVARAGNGENAHVKKAIQRKSRPLPKSFF